MHFAIKPWEIIADNLTKSGWSWGCVSAVDSQGRTQSALRTHIADGKRLIVRADEIRAAFFGLEVAIRGLRQIVLDESGEVFQD